MYDMRKICLNCMHEMGDFDVCDKCGWIETDIPSEPFELNPGIILHNRYLIGMASAIGGFGILYHGFDLTLNMHIAVKEFYPQGIVNRAPGDNNLIIFSGNKKKIYETQLRRFLEEARIQAKFSNDPNFVKVIDYFEANNTAYIVMEFLEGKSLKDYLKENPVIEEENAIKILVPVMDALSEMHKQNIIHRDVNPNNIFITQMGQTKLLDFGTARLSNLDNEKDLTVIVTPGYAPAEQYKKEEKQGGYTDEYAVAATLYRMLTGKIPEESTDRIIKDELIAPRVLNSDISLETESVILRGMAPEVKLRFKTIDEFKNALLANQKVRLPEEIIQRQKVRRRITVASVLLFVCIVAGTFIYNSIKRGDAALNGDAVGEEVINLALCEESGIDLSVYDEIVEKFNQEYPNIHINIDVISSEDYESTVKDGKYQIYRRDMVELDNNADLSLLYESLDLNNYDVISNNLSELKHDNKVPTGFKISVLYLNKYLCNELAEIDTSDMTFEEFYEIRDSYEELGGFQHCYISDSQILQVLQSSGFETTIYSKELDEILDKVNTLNGNNELDVDYNEMLKNNQLLSYLGSSDDYRLIQKMNGGNYIVNEPLSNGIILGDYTQVWSIVDTDETTNQAAMLFLGFLLSDISQNYLYLQNDYGLPINETTLSNYSNEFSYMKDNLNRIKIIENYENLGIKILEQYKN